MRKVLLVGSGGVGAAIASIAAKNDKKAEWLEEMVVSDYNLNRAKDVAAGLNDDRFVPEQIRLNLRLNLIYVKYFQGLH